MKQRLVLSILMAILVAGIGFSQSLTTAEYFLDGDPGFGGGIPITIDTPFDTVEQSFPITLSDTLSRGYHWLYIRSRDDMGRWSIAKGHKIYVFRDAHPNVILDQPDVTGFEYFMDEEPGAGMGTWVSTTPADSFDHVMAIATSGLAPGYHKLYTRAKDSDGRWGHLNMRKVYIFSDTIVSLVTSQARITAAEYFFDDNVPFGQGTAIPITKGDTVEWSGQINVTGLLAGEHHLVIRVKDSVGVWSIAYSKPFSVVGLSSTTNSPICQGSADGTATVSIKGGKPPFTYLWDDPEQQSDSTVTGLKAGKYTVTVQDAEGAVIKETVEITERDTIQITITKSDTECKDNKGSATAVATGGSQPYTYLWTSGSEEANATGLRSGIYEVTVTDKAMCQNKALATINDIGGPDISTVGRVIHLECAGETNGVIDPQISGGSAPYTYSWSNGEVTKGIQNLRAGTYELTVKDAQECFASQSIKVEEPQPLTFSLSVVEADCGSPNGAATVSVTGGTIPYGYEWTGFTEHYNPTRTGLAAGVYEVTVTDKEGCSSITQVAVSEKGAPSVNVTSVMQSTCGNSDGSILTSVVGGTGSYTFVWKNEAGSVGTDDKDLIGVGPGEYSLSVSDNGSGCKTFAAATIPAELPPTEMICLVSVDTTDTEPNNVIVWNETPGAGIVGYTLYRETSSAGVFDSIAYIPADSLSIYTDLYADPEIRSWRYRISAVNSCGVESRLSPPHKTMHLTLNLGLLNYINLIWNHYEGFVPKDGSYKIWRHTPGLGWDMIGTVPSNQNTYTDKNPPDADIWYFVEAEHPTGCTAVKAATLNSSRSNRKTKLKSAPESVNSFRDQYNLIVYPNPSNGKFKLMMDIDGFEDLYIKVFDMSGKIVYRGELKDVNQKLNHEIDLSQLENGMYQLHLKTDRGIYNKTLVIR